jgi:iron complex transport system substrate-binding protein
MNRGFVTLLGLALLWGAVSALAFADEPVVVRDSAHHELHLDHRPQRVITLLPSLTETVCALDECSRLVATDRYSNWPASVRALPKTGGLEDAEIEQIVNLAPDVVILAQERQVADRLRELHIATFDVETWTYADIARTVAMIGLLFGVSDRAAALNRSIESGVDTVVERAKRSLHGRTPLIYYEVDNGPYAAGPRSFIGEMLGRLGVRNILTPDLGQFPHLNPEYVVRHNPDVIFISPTEAPNLAQRPGWDQIRAVREKRLCSFAPEVRDTIVRPGPRVAEGLQAIADCLSRVAP